MARESSRLDKINDLLKRELALLIQNEVRDPRIGMVSITEVRASRDLAYAVVYLTVVGKSDAADARESIEGLNRAAGFLRSQLARNISLRTTPKLNFQYDDTLNRGRHLSDLIDKAVARDKSRHNQN